jgi:O-antigen/teichoic acid export membrane protein
MSSDKATATKGGLSKRAALLAVAKVAGYALTLPLPLVLVRVLSQSDFGLYKQAFQIITTLLTLLGLQVGLSIYYFIPRHPDRKPHVVMNVLVFYAALGGLTALLFAAYPQWITHVFKTDDLVPYVPLVGAAILLWLMGSLLEVVTLADGDVRSASTFTVAIQFTKSALLIAAGLAFGTIRAVVLAAVVQGAVLCAILFTYLYKRYGQFWRAFDAQLFRAQFANALPFGLGALAYGMQADMHNYFVSHYFEPAAFAIYAVGCFELPLLAILYESVVMILFPEVARLQAAGDGDGVINLWAAAMRKLAFFYVPTYVLMFVLRAEIITLLFTKDYAASADIFAINLLLLPMFLCVYTAFMRAFDDLRFYRLKQSLVMIPLAAAAVYTGIHLGGLRGAIAGAVAAQLIDAAAMMLKVGRRVGVRAAHFTQLVPILRTVIASGAAAAAACFVKASLGDARTAVVLMACAAAFGAVFAAVAYAVGAVTDEEKSELRRVYRSGSRRLGLSSATEAQ